MNGADVAASRLPWDAADPYPFYEACRPAGGVVWDDATQAWLILGYRAARDVLASPGWSSAPRTDQARIESFGSPFTDATMLFTDGAAHDRLRRSVREVFSRTSIDRLGTGIESICADAISTIPADEPVDLMSQVLIPLPIAIIGTWLGLDSDQCVALHEHSPAIARILGGPVDQLELDDGLGAAAALLTNFLPAAADRRARPRGDLLSYLATDRTLTLDEVVATAILIAVAGHETTANLLGASLIRLLTSTDDGNRLADRIDGSDPAVVTELLRLDTPVHAVARTATADQIVGGIDIDCGEMALVCLAAANRDPDVYARPAEFLPGRRGPAPLTFGHGMHYCLGVALARLEIGTALRHILSRRPFLAGPPIWRDTPAIRGPLSVPVRFTN